MINIHQAIWHKYPGVEGITIIGDKITEWPEAALGPKPTADAIQVMKDEYESQVAQDEADYIANEKYKDDRREAYSDVGDQLDMQYWDGVNNTTVWADHIAAVKLANPKPD